jgi:hypothetical protein
VVPILIPGLLQTAEYARALSIAAPIRATVVKRAYGPDPVTTRAVGLG